jgi:hypothetical protein
MTLYLWHFCWADDLLRCFDREASALTNSVSETAQSTVWAACNAEVVVYAVSTWVIH